MRIKLLKPFGFSEPGDLLDPDPPIAQLLIDRGVAVAISSQQKAIVADVQNKVVKTSHARNKNDQISKTAR